MELLTVVKGSKITVDHLFDAFRTMERGNTTRVEMHGRIFTLSNPVENVWYVHAFDTTGKQLAVSMFDQFDL